MSEESQKLNFTKKELADLPSAQDAIYWDAKTRGLFLRVTAGVKSFYVRRKVKGRSERLYLGRFPELSVEQARAKAAEFHANLAQGKNISEARRMERSEPTLGELFVEYMDRHATKTRKTATEIEKQFERNFAQWKNYKISVISPEDLEKLHIAIGKTRGPYAANRAIELASALYNKAIKWKLYRGENPAADVSPYPERARKRVLQAHEFAGFFAAVEKEDQDIQDLILLALLTGARKSNVLSMSWDNINLKGHTWTIPGEQTKNGESQEVPLTEAELRILNRRYLTRKNRYVFFGEGGTGHLVEPKRAWARVLRAAGIENLRFHDLRRSLASWMANSGANVAFIQSALNHKDIKTTLTVYAHTAKDEERKARKRAHDLMLGE